MVCVKLGGKWLKLFKEAVPRIARVAVLYDPARSFNVIQVKEVLPVAALGLTIGVGEFSRKPRKDEKQVNVVNNVPYLLYEGERKQVTVLFADLKGSMELLADRDPEESWTLLNAVVERMMEAVHRYEGTVNNVMGDGIMATFGAPLAHEDHALRACYAALRMQD